MVEERGRIKPIPFFIHHKTHRPTQGFLKTQIMKTTAEELLKKKLDELSQHSNYQPYKYWESILKETIIEAMEELASLKEDKPEYYDLKKLYDWIRDDKPKPALTAFTSGIARNIASEIEYQRSLKEDKWIGVETPPEKAGSFIVSDNGKSKQAFYSFGFKRWYVKSTAPLEVADMEINPTHWTPLPSPHKTEK